MQQHLLRIVTSVFILLGVNAYALPPVLDGEVSNTALSSSSMYAASTNGADEDDLVTMDRETNASVIHKTDKQNDTMLSERINELQQTIQELQGKLEEQAHTIELLQSTHQKEIAELKTKVETLNSRIDALNSTATKSMIHQTSASQLIPAKNNNLVNSQHVEPSKSKKQSSQEIVSTTVREISKEKENNSVNTADTNDYNTAFKLIKQQKLELAKARLHEFLQAHPKSDYADRAHYWVGEIALLKDDIESARTEFLTILSQYPHSAKIADVRLKLGDIYAKTGQIEAAKNEYHTILQRYPQSTAAEAAANNLKQLKAKSKNSTSS